MGLVFEAGDPVRIVFVLVDDGKYGLGQLTSEQGEIEPSISGPMRELGGANNPDCGVAWVSGVECVFAGGQRLFAELLLEFL